MPIIIFFILLSIYSNLYAENLPDLGGSYQRNLSIQAERELGSTIKIALEAQFYIVQDLEIQSYIDNLSLRLHSSSDIAHQYPLTLFVISSPEINAFAAPGGYIGINTGLILATDKEEELAGVLAHEIGHLVQKHFARSLELQNRLGLSTIAGLIATALIGGQNAELAEAILFSTIAGNTQKTLSFSRENEMEADRTAVFLLSKTGFSPQGVADFFAKLQQLSFGGGSIPEYLRTHPLTENRISNTRSLANRLTAQKTIYSIIDYQLFKARLEILLTKDSKSLVKNVAKQYYSNPDFLNSYRYGLALEKNGQFSEAEKILYQASKTKDHLWLQLAYFNILDKSGKSKAALDKYQIIYQIYPFSYPVLHYYSNALINNDKAKQAVRILRNNSNTYHYKPEFFQLLARAEYATDNLVSGLEAMSYYYELEGYLKEAATQLEIALNQPSIDNIRRARLQARLDQLKAAFQ